MIRIYKSHDNSTVNFAADELKKYLKMMMPDCGEVLILRSSGETDGFRLGLLEDFSIPFHGEDAGIDDEVYISTTETAGILAGSNPRSVLFAVYRYLICNGCRFLFPGTDGEYIPKKKVVPVEYQKLADYRYRCHATEGDPGIDDVLRYIDYQAKQFMNSYALYSIFPYHRRYYMHRHNEQNRPPEPVSYELVEQWQALCEAEIEKRGMEIWAGGHSWVGNVAGFDPSDRYLYREGKEVSEDIRQNLAMINGERGLFHSDPAYTNICMSRKDLRTKMANLVVDYVEKHKQHNQVAIYLADNNHNHCECPECRKQSPSDYYIMILNEIDELLTKKGLSTKLQMIAYVDCMFAPKKQRLNNPDRFVLKATPISREYKKSITEDSVFPPAQPYKRNAWEPPATAEAYFSQFKEWQAIFPGTCIAYEYHYWVHQYRDPGMLFMSRRIYEDVRSWKVLGLDGGLEDGSNKSFFPNGFIDHIFGATLWDRSLDYNHELADYFRHIYGEDWQCVKDYLENISDAFGNGYLCDHKRISSLYKAKFNPEREAEFKRVFSLTSKMREIAGSHIAMPNRPQTVSWRLLLRHTQWCDGIANVLILKCHGDTEGAINSWKQFLTEMGKHDFETERYFDFGIAAESILVILKKKPKLEF